MENWMNEVYDRTKEPTFQMFYEWTISYFKTLDLGFIISLAILLVVFLIVYSVLMKNPLKASLILGVIVTIGFCTYYVFIFQPSYPKEQVVKALNSEEAVAFLEDRERQRTEIRGLIVEEVDFTEVTREDVHMIGPIDTERLKKVTFTIKNEEGMEQYKGYAYIEDAPPGTKRTYVEYYTMDESKVIPQILSEEFFDIKMYNMIIYKK